MRAFLVATLPSIAAAAAAFSHAEHAAARKLLRNQLHHIGAEGDLVEDFIDKLLAQSMADPANLHKLEDWVEETTLMPNGVIHSEYLSPSFKLMTGAAHFTLNPFYRIPVPKGDYVVLDQAWDIVEDDGKTQVPLTTMYNHHWLIGGDLPLDMCEGDYFFGGGAEYRHMDYTLSPGYGMPRVNATGVCGGNLHFISTEDLAVQWKGFNDPAGSHGAAMKLACECGYEPGRAHGLCEKWGDGSFLCCFTLSRARTNNPSNRKTKSFRIKGKWDYTRDFTGITPVATSLLDVGGNNRMVNGQLLDMINEWTVESNLNNEGVFTRCNDTVCGAQRSVTVEDGSSFGNGICPGTMLWSYIHQHGGMISGHMAINGKEHCNSTGMIGTDASNPVGNEQGFLVGITQCVDDKVMGNKVRLNKGDVLTLTSYYDVDPASTRHYPMPGGKHGGIMALFFSMMNCDAGTWGEVYVKRNGTCVGVPRSKSHRVGPFFETKDACEHGEEASATPRSKKFLESPKQVAMPSASEPASTIGKVDLVWRDCGSPSKWVNFTGIAPPSMSLNGLNTTVTSSGVLSKPIQEANLTIKMASGGFGLTLASFEGNACKEEPLVTLLDQIHLTWQPLSCPMVAGTFAAQVKINIGVLIPTLIAQTTTTVMAHSHGEEIFCIEIMTNAPQPDDFV